MNGRRCSLVIFLVAVAGAQPLACNVLDSLGECTSNAGCPSGRCDVASRTCESQSRPEADAAIDGTGPANVSDGGQSDGSPDSAANPDAGGPPWPVPGEHTSIGIEPVGPNCEAGGIVIASGADANANEKLDEGEVTHRTYVCNPVNGKTVFGDYTIRSSIDLDALAGVTRITGSLAIEAPDLPNVALPDLAALGSLTIVGVGNTVSMPALKSVIGLQLGATATLTTLSLPELRVADSISLRPGATNRLTSISLPKLIATDGFAVADLKVSAFPTPSLRGAIDFVQIEHNAFSSIDALRGVAFIRELHITKNDQLPDFAGLANVQVSTLHIADNAGLTSLHGLERVRPVVFDLNLVKSPLIADISAISNITQARDFHIGDTGKLRTIALPKLAHARSITIGASAAPSALTTIDLAALATVDVGLTIADVKVLSTLRLTQLAKVPTLTITSNAGLPSVQLPKLTTVDTLTVRGGDALTIEIPALDTVAGPLDLAAGAATLPELVTVQGPLTIVRGGGALQVQLPKLFSVRGLSLRGVGSTAGLVMPALTAIDGPGELDVSGTGFTDLAGLGSVRTVSSLKITGNASLTSIGMAKLTSAPAFTISYNGALDTCLANALLQQLTSTPQSYSIVGNKAGCP